MPTPISLQAKTLAANTTSLPSVWRDAMARAVSRVYLTALYLALPVMPLLASILFMKLKYVRHYATTLRKCTVHVAALAEGPANHYFRDVAGLVKTIPNDIEGSCVQCGNCCMERRCMFLEPIDDGNKFNCGIYGSVWRRFSNCGSFPINRHDIERYDCPSYFVKGEAPLHFVAGAGRRTETDAG